MRLPFRFRNQTRQPVAAACALALAAALMPAAAKAAVPPGSGSGTYVNPISQGFADTYADPAIIKAKDGWWYSYATSDPLQEGPGEPFGNLHVARSRDLVTWSYVGEVFGEGAPRPTWADPESLYWAPDIRYLDGRYVLYYTVTNTVDDPANPAGFDPGIGAATSSTPYGPWIDSGAPVVAPRPNPCCQDNFYWTFDPSQFTDIDGTKYLYYGSYYGGVFVTRLDSTGTRRVGDPVQVTINDKYEGAYVVRHDGAYYLFGSSANCCAGPTTGYSVSVGRSDSPLGPFVDRDGASLLASRVGGTPVIVPNGNRWVGPGHNAIATDLSGQDWLVYHAIDRADPFLNEPFEINERPMLLDRLDWVDGWPIVRGGAFASEGEEEAPVAQPTSGDSFNRGGLDGFAVRGGSWRIARGDGGGSLEQRASARRGTAFLLERDLQPADVRVEADVRLAGGRAAGVVVRRSSASNYAAAWLDKAAHALVTDVVVAGNHSRRYVDLSADLDLGDWHNVAVEVRGSALVVEVTDARLGDPVAEAVRTLPVALDGGRYAALIAVGRARFDNFGATALYEPNTDLEGTPTLGALAPEASDEFDDAGLGPEWSWVRAPDGTQAGGQFVWPTQPGDLVGENGANSASVLLRSAPAGSYLVETKLTIDLGVDDVKNYRQAGLIAYVTDDLWTRLTNVAIWNTRQIEFGKEQPFADGLSFGGMNAFGATSDTVWLRLAHRLDPVNGEHEFRAGKSLDGSSWTWGGVWTLPADTTPRIGLLSLGGAGSTTQFDWFRTYTGGAWNG